MEEPSVGTLLEAFRTSHFSFASYYVLSFGVLPSGLRLELPVERSKETVDAVLKSIDLQRFAFEPRTRLWMTADFKGSQIADDYVFDYLFKSQAGRMVMHLWFGETKLDIDFYYD